MVKRTPRSKRTRKARGLTVEALHASFDKIDTKVYGLMKKNATDSQIACCIQKSWKELFHTTVSDTAVKGLVKHYRAVHGSQRKTRKNQKSQKSQKSQRGGMAPLDYMMGPGNTDQTFGRFPVEMGVTPNVLNGLDLGRFYESGVSRSCDTTGGHSAINQRGGSLWSAFMNGHVPPSVQPNTLQTVVNAVQGGAPLAPGASPVTNHVNLTSYIPKPYDPTGTYIPGYTTLYRPTS